ncbi:MAG: 6-phosphogluconolactonase [Rudaea sp.]
MSVAPVEQVFADADTLALALAGAVGADLRKALSERSTAALAVPGGATPRKFLTALSRLTLDWPRVTVTLTDERQVPADDPRANTRLLREALLERAPARFVPPAEAHNGEVDSAGLAATLRMPFDAVVIGMGADGHCASLFADGDNIAAALRTDAAVAFVPMRSPSASEPRITLTLSALVDTRALFVLIEGARKRHTLDAALRGEAPFAQAPVRAVLANAAVAPQIYWCP